MVNNCPKLLFGLLVPTCAGSHFFIVLLVEMR